ncbi:hypothetical protein CF65_02816 [Aggregatibacter actinomycetemcomitans HK1651]|nr:hypothetical protein CF65_02816 [Aggregatibacter actinomycetemcomitans HK1651]
MDFIHRAATENNLILSCYGKLHFYTLNVVNALSTLLLLFRTTRQRMAQWVAVTIFSLSPSFSITCWAILRRFILFAGSVLNNK